MSTVTRLSPQKSKKRVNLYLDGKFFCGLDLSVVLRHSLKAGQELSEEKLATLVNQSEKESLFQKAANFISYRPRSEKEVRDYLSRKITSRVESPTPQGCKQKVTLINQSIKRLKKSGLLNDFDFAKWWVGQRLEFRPKGRFALKAELFKKGIDRKIIDEILKNISSKEEVKAAKKIYEKAKRQLKSIEPKKKKERLIRRLSSRGFSWNIIKMLVDENGL